MKKILYSLLFLLFLGCSSPENKEYKMIEEKEHTLLQQVKDSGKLKAVIGYNVTSYFIYKGSAMGFQYEMLQALSQHLGVKLELTVSDNLKSSFQKLDTKKVDLVAMNLVATPQRLSKYNFSIPHSQSHQVLIQKNRYGNKIYIDSVAQLAGKTVYVVKESSYQKQLEKISKNLQIPINIIAIDSLLSDDLINKVAKGEIDFTVADNNSAIANKHYHKNIDVSLRISNSEAFAWALKKDDDSLTEEINKWLVNFKKTKYYAFINYRYFKNKKSLKILNNEFYTLKSGKISKYDSLFKIKAKMINWDWRLLASLVYQESHFESNARSWVGAFGLMQLMPNTAKRYGVNRNSSDEENITGGVRYLMQVDKELRRSLKDTTDLIPFILAAYNVGLGHVQDAQRLARKYGANPHKWYNNVAYYIQKKARSDFYNDPLVKYGYCRGREPYLYVSEVLDRYQHYKNITNKQQN